MIALPVCGHPSVISLLHVGIELNYQDPGLKKIQQLPGFHVSSQSFIMANVLSEKIM
uniref:Uncharacterized protein n=1 Tax=Arundo donax TaxID=35708 RepID=A0A0A9F3Y9_ARUDO